MWIILFIIVPMISAIDQNCTQAEKIGESDHLELCNGWLINTNGFNSLKLLDNVQGFLFDNIRGIIFYKRNGTVYSSVNHTPAVHTRSTSLFHVIGIAIIAILIIVVIYLKSIV